jgi:hypothetical protein
MKIIAVENNIDLYKSLLEQVNSDHTVFITVLLGIVVILLGTTWWWNFTGANKRMISIVKKETLKHQKELLVSFKQIISNQVKSEICAHEQSLLKVEGNAIRSLALQAKRDGHYKHSIYWWVRHLEIYFKLDEKFEDEMRNTVNWIIADIELLKIQDNEGKVESPLIYNKDYIIKTVSQLSNILKIEKDIIIDFVKKRAEMKNNNDS